jgi:hypothetical protein
MLPLSLAVPAGSAARQTAVGALRLAAFETSQPDLAARGHDN